MAVLSICSLITYKHVIILTFYTINSGDHSHIFHHQLITFYQLSSRHIQKPTPKTVYHQMSILFPALMHFTWLRKQRAAARPGNTRFGLRSRRTCGYLRVLSLN